MPYKKPASAAKKPMPRKSSKPMESKPVPFGGVKKKKKTGPKSHGNAKTPGFAYGKKTI